ncbi:hypothetical protein LINPERHAP1_LOCUS7739, partial [Linum perenne]
TDLFLRLLPPVDCSSPYDWVLLLLWFLLRLVPPPHPTPSSDGLLRNDCFFRRYLLYPFHFFIFVSAEDDYCQLSLDTPANYEHVNSSFYLQSRSRSPTEAIQTENPHLFIRFGRSFICSI